MALLRRALVIALLFAPACADSPPPPAASPVEEAKPTAGKRHHRAHASSPDAPAANAGTSDGTTCEEARDRYVEEMDMRSGAAPDLTAGDLGDVLNNGGYLAPCAVPTTSHVQICVAVQQGAAVGVTVALDPSDPDAELCVAQAVRALSFPSNPKMDVATVRF
jgi:hypothetical protein